MLKVSVIIPSYNRFNLLLRAIRSVQSQTYKNIEIIVVNDYSSEQLYYEYNYGELIDCKTEDNYIIYYYDSLTLINLNKRSKELFGFVNLSYVRNVGIKNSNSYFVAFLDDDDIWLKDKIEIQIKEMKKYECCMSSTEGYNGINSSIWKISQKIKRRKIKEKPKIWDINFFKKGNFFITSSVIVSREILEKVNFFDENFKPPSEDKDLWRRCLNFTKSVFINKPMMKYDKYHGNGKKYIS